HIDMSLSQMGPWRPTPALSGYRTPVAGLWHASAGSHPLPSVNGWAGRTAARTLLARERSGWRGRRRQPGEAAPAPVGAAPSPVTVAAPAPACRELTVRGGSAHPGP